MKIENKIEVFNIPDMVTCKICMGTYKIINDAHLKKHGMATKQYLKKYPNAIITGSLTRLKQSKQRKQYLKNHPEILVRANDWSKKMKDKQTIESRKREKKMGKIVLNLPRYRRQNADRVKNRWKNIKGTFEEELLNKKISDGVKKYLKNNPEEIMKRCKNMENGRNIRNRKLIKKKKEKMPLIIKLFEQGNSLSEIGRKVGVSNSTIESWLEEKGYSIKKYRNIQKIETKKLRKRGYTLEQISHKLNKSTSTIYYWLKDGDSVI